MRRRILDEEKILNLSYDFVDMGLSVNWATCNVGASSPEEGGLYFAWGETEGYPDLNSGKKFTPHDYKFAEISKDETGEDGWWPNKYYQYDDLSTLELEDDAAHVNMGGVWRMPTIEETKELCYACDITHHTQNGVDGLLFSLKTDENKKLFFPESNWLTSPGYELEDGYGGIMDFYYYTSQLYEAGQASSSEAGTFHIVPDNYQLSLDYLNALYRYMGARVRGVFDNPDYYKYITVIIDSDKVRNIVLNINGAGNQVITSSQRIQVVKGSYCVCVAINTLPGYRSTKSANYYTVYDIQNDIVINPEIIKI